MQPLPFSIQSFPRLRQLGCIYVDKTKFAYDLIVQEQSFFLARPRRFGKSLFVSTLREILLGHRNLFHGCWIDKSSYAWPVYGVIDLDFAPIKSANAATVEKSLCQMLLRVAENYQILLDTDFTDPNATLIMLTRALYAKYKKVAILIDEYDHPILQVLQDSQAGEVRAVLQSFFTTVKSLNDYVYFLFITGVSMFSKAGVFSGMNNPKNLSLDPQMADACGYTEAEIDFYFQDHLKTWCEAEEISFGQLRQQLKDWYNGYRFSKEPVSVYNPFSILSALNQKEWRNFWFETGSPSFVVKELQKTYRHQEWKLFHLDHFKSSAHLLGAIDVHEIPLPTLLFQTGYLTLAKYDKVSQNYWLEFPNREVETALHQQLLPLMTHASAECVDYAAKELPALFMREDIAGVVACL